MKRMVGKKIFDAFHPDRYYNHDAEDPGRISFTFGKTAQGETVNINRRAVESDLVIYVNINFVPMDGGHKSVAVGLCDYESVRVHHDPDTIAACDSIHGSAALR
jgi:nickel-dependent lactate racemase